MGEDRGDSPLRSSLTSSPPPPPCGAEVVGVTGVFLRSSKRILRGLPTGRFTLPSSPFLLPLAPLPPLPPPLSSLTFPAEWTPLSPSVPSPVLRYIS